MSSTKGYKATDWDLTQQLWTGRLRIVERTSGKVFIQLEDSSNGELFASCPYQPDEYCVEPVTDSSRYFVLKIVDIESGSKAYIGLGFQDRSEAFDFNVALQDYAKRFKKEVVSSSSTASDHKLLDLSLKEGQKIVINLGKGNNVTSSSTIKGSSGNIPSEVLPILPPPPKSNSSLSLLSTELKQKEQRPHENECTIQETSTTEQQDVWDDFQDAR